ncbi:MAG TPA: DUF4394 domain-containing protein [Chthoniobacterales bacterium]|nr:DUF4394 domain-containing protein [Chthoniobacterales bacterium]
MNRKLLPIGAVAIAAAISAQAEPITVLTSGTPQRLLTIDSASPSTTSDDSVRITGLAAGETLLGIDYRPATGTLYGLGSTSRIYSINADTGVATAVGSGGAFTLNGTRFAFDFNPVPDRIRITSDADQNLRVNPNDGTATVDGPIAYAATDANNGKNPSAVGGAYTNNFAGAGATTLYDIDSTQDVLVIQNPPNSGTLNTVGPLGVNTTDDVGFDISGRTGVAFAALEVTAGIAELFTINLLSGQATRTTTPTSVIAPAALGTDSVVDIAAFVNPGSRVDNISTRGRVGSSDQDFLIAGFITRGGVSSRILVRGIGPSLSNRGVTNPLADPVLEVFDNNGMSVAQNDNWRSSQQDEIEGTGLEPQNDAEAAILRSLAPGTYTAVLSGKNGGTGVALVEVFQVQQ